ncbi:winged helix-turn-helix domain-containing protein [Streptomyces sp. NPDC051286]|uniref:winged helix-turn-helix domain-containing protein n=1 Tax=Streptomyces sp. NPDC051286 TaxID=3365647 RepID=UPI0037AE7DC0
MTGVLVGRRGRRPAGSGVQLTFEVIAEAVRERIRSGGLRPGDALPTQAVLMQEFGASSLTVQKAMALLKQDGWAVSRPGKGRPFTCVAQAHRGRWPAPPPVESWTPRRPTLAAAPSPPGLRAAAPAGHRHRPDVRRQRG